MNVGRRIREARAKKEMTRAQLARRVGVGRTQIDNYENGYSYPSFRVAVRLVDILGENLFCPPRGKSKLDKSRRAKA